MSRSLVSLFCAIVLVHHWMSSAQAAPDLKSDRSTEQDIQVRQAAPFVENYPPRVYQSHPQVWSIAEDQRGVMFFGDGDGWLDFDGVRWQHTKTTHSVFSMDADSDGVVYVGLIDDFGRLLADDKGKLVYQSLTDRLDGSERKLKPVWDTQATDQGVYFNTVSGRIFRWFDGQLQTIELKVGRRMSPVGNQLYVFNKDGVFSIQGKRAVLLPETQGLSDGKQTLLVLPYSEDQLLIATAGKGFYLYTVGSKRETLGPLQDSASPVNPIRVFETPVVDLLKQRQLMLGIRLNDGNYAFGTRFGGLVLMDPAGQALMTVDESNGLTNNFVRDLYQDKTGNLWVATNDGISYVELTSPLSRFDDGEQSGFTLTAARYRGRLFIGGFEGVFYHDGYGSGHKPRLVPLKGISSFCWEMLVHRDRLLIGGGFGLMVVNGTRIVHRGKTERAVYSFGTSPRFPQHVFVGFRDGMAALTIEEANPGDVRFALLDPEQGDFAKINGEIREILSDAAGHLWVTDLIGQIYYLRFRGDEVSDFEVYVYNQAQGLPETGYNMVHMIDGRLMVGTKRGLYSPRVSNLQAVDPASITFSLDDQLGLEPNRESLRAHRIVQDRGGRIWISSYTDVSSLTNKPDGSYVWNRQRYKKIEGSVEYIFLDDDNVVWFTNSSGLYRYDQRLEPVDEARFNAVISRVSLQNGTDLFRGVHCQSAVQSGGICDAPAPEQHKGAIAEIPHKLSSLIMTLGAAAYERPKLNSYSYKLDGFDETWSDWSNVTRKEYTSLREGDYRFRLRAKNIYEHPSREASFAFRVLPPWHRTIWAQAAYFVLGLGLVVLSFRIYAWRLLAAKKRALKRATELEVQVQNRTAEVETQANQLQLTNSELQMKNQEAIEQREEIKKAHGALWGEMQLAKKIQTVLLPQQPALTGFDVAVYMAPADDVGGDYYDVIQMDDSTQWVVIGDVSGHGVPAGLIMMMVQTSIRTALKEKPQASPIEILALVNSVIYDNIRSLGEDKYMTITVLACHNQETFYFAGLHQDIKVYRARTGEVELVETNGMWLGVMEEIGEMLDIGSVSLAPGDTMLLDTDGIIESTDADGRMYSSVKLTRLLAGIGSRPVAEIKQEIIDSLKDYNCHDDVTFVILKRARF